MSHSGFSEHAPTADSLLDGFGSDEECAAPPSENRQNDCRSDDPPASAALCWQIHLLRTQPARLPGVIVVGGIGAACVWLMFGTWLPALAALLLLMGSVNEYLFPITYRLTAQGIAQESLTTRIALPWTSARRCRIGKQGILILSLAMPSRLDAFRGVFLRFAPDHQPGDRNSVLALLAVYAPRLLKSAQQPNHNDIHAPGEADL